jgi:cation efflux system membrane fusion protein
MKSFRIASSVLAVSLAITTPTVAFAHVGHGDEFQAEGGVNRVEVNVETDSLLGIQVNPIEPAADGSGAVLIPVTALVEDAGRQLVFVQYGTFYEPVPVTTGATQGDLIEITEGLSVGEQLVTQGSLTLYAESRKTQAPITTDEAHAQVDAQGIPHSHDAAGNLVESGDAAQSSRQFPLGLAVAMTAISAVGAGVMTVISSNRKKRSPFSEGTYSKKKGGF